MPVHNAQSQQGFRQSLADHDIVIVDYYATWCAPCKVLAPVFEKFSENPKYEGVLFLKFDVDQLSSLADELDIQAMPTVQVFKKGQKVDSVVEPKPDALEAMLDKAVAAE